MKDLSLLVWLTQLGFSVVVPLAGLTLLAVWLRDHLGWGDWVVPVGVILGFVFAVDGFRHSLRMMSRLTKDKKKQEPPPVAFNDHD